MVHFHIDPFIVNLGPFPMSIRANDAVQPEPFFPVFTIRKFGKAYLMQMPKRRHLAQKRTANRLVCVYLNNVL